MAHLLLVWRFDHQTGVHPDDVERRRRIRDLPAARQAQETLLPRHRSRGGGSADLCGGSVRGRRRAPGRARIATGTPSTVRPADRLRRALQASTPDGSIPPTLAHGDFHGGNVLWDGVRVTAVLDWPLATRASRWWDEAYAHMDTWLAHGEASATTFRSAYRARSGDRPDPEHQRFWDLSALVRALPSPGQWLDSYRHAGANSLR